jgi:tRNA(adenine34) deaminase
VISDDELMGECVRLSGLAALNGNHPVGAVVALDGEIIGRGEEATNSKSDITCHAEIEAIRQAVATLKTADLSNCTLYSTHEPCIMCSYVIRFHKVNRVVFNKRSDHLGGFSSSMPLLISTEVPSNWSKPPVVNEYKI